MKKVWKYDIPLHGDFELELPNDTKILCIKEQKGLPKMWMSVPQDVSPHQMKKFKFKIVMTGEAYDEDLVGHYVGSFQIEGGHTYVGHLFRKGI